MRLIVSRKGLGILLVGITLELTALVLLGVRPSSPTFCCLDTPSSIVSPVISSSWFVALSTLIVVTIGAAIFRVLAGVGLVTTVGATIAMAYLVFFQFPSAYLAPPWFPACPIDWLGAALVLTTITRAIMPRELPRPRIGPPKRVGLD